MHTGNKIIASIILICILCPLFVIIPTKTYAYTSEEVGKAIAEVAERIVTEGNDNVRGQILRYSQKPEHRRAGFLWIPVTDNEPAITENGVEGEPIPGKLAFDCSSFCSYVYKHVTSGVFNQLWSTGDWGGKDNNEYFDRIPREDAQIGDILWRDRSCCYSYRRRKSSRSIRFGCTISR